MRTQQFWTARPPSLPCLLLQRQRASPTRLLTMLRISMCAWPRTLGFAQRWRRSNNHRSTRRGQTTRFVRVSSLKDERCNFYTTQNRVLKKSTHPSFAQVMAPLVKGMQEIVEAADKNKIKP